MSRVNPTDDYDKALEKAKEKHRILECQWERSRGYKSPDCEACKDRFRCRTTKARQFIVTELYQGCTRYSTFAETEDEARELYEEFIGDDTLFLEGKSETFGEGIEVEEAIQ